MIDWKNIEKIAIERSNQKGWNAHRSGTYKWVRFVIFAALFGSIVYGNRRAGGYSLDVMQCLMAILVVGALAWFWRVATPEERSWGKQKVRKP